MRSFFDAHNVPASSRKRSSFKSGEKYFTRHDREKMLPRLPSDMIRAAFPESSLPKWLQRSFQNSYQTKADKNAIMSALHVIKAADPLYYNSLIDRHTKSYRTKPVVVKNLLKNGVITDDGSLRMNKKEKVGVRRAVRLIEEREAKVQQLEAQKQERTKRLKQAVCCRDLHRAPIDGVNSTMSKRKVSPSLDKVLQHSSVAHAQLKSSTKVPWKLFSPSNSSSTRLPYVVKAAQGELKVTCTSKPAAQNCQKAVCHATSVVASLDPIRRAKLRGMLNEEEEALRKIIVSELQLARKAEQKAKQVQERTACREATLKAELSAEKERNRLERKRKVALQALVTECERWAAVKREKANSLNKQVEHMKQRTELAIQEGKVLHLGTTKGNSATMPSNATSISKKPLPTAISSLPTNPSIPTAPNTLPTLNGTVCSASTTTLTASLVEEPKGPSTMAASPVVVSSANTSTTDILNVPSNETAAVAAALINAIPSKASSPVAHKGAHDLPPIPAPPCTSGVSADLSNVTVEASNESLGSTASANSEGSSVHASGEPISQMVATPATVKATPSPISKIPAHISRATNTSPHLLDSYLTNFAEGKDKSASHPARTSPQSSRRRLQVTTYSVPAESQSVVVHTIPPSMQGPPIPRLRSLADVCSEVDTILAESRGNSAENLSTTSSLCAGETSMTSGGLWNGAKRSSSASDVGEGPSKLLSLSSKSCHSKRGSETESLQKERRRVSESGVSSQYSSRRTARPSTPINKLLSNASSGLHHFSSSLQSIGEDPEAEYANMEYIPQEPCKAHDNENAPSTVFEQDPRKLTSALNSASNHSLQKRADGPNLGSDVATRIDCEQSKDIATAGKAMESSEEGSPVTVLQVPAASGTYIFEVQVHKAEENDPSIFEDATEEPLSTREPQASSVNTGNTSKATIATTNEQSAFPLSMSSPCSHCMGRESIQSAGKSDLSKLHMSGSAPPTFSIFQTIKAPPSFGNPCSTVPLPIFDSPQSGCVPPQFTGPQMGKGAVNSTRGNVGVARAHVEGYSEGDNAVSELDNKSQDTLPKNNASNTENVKMSFTPPLKSPLNAVMERKPVKWVLSKQPN